MNNDENYEDITSAIHIFFCLSSKHSLAVGEWENVMFM